MKTCPQSPPRGNRLAVAEAMLAVVMRRLPLLRCRLHGRWIKLDATIDAPTASRLGKPYSVEFDGHADIPTVEGPVLRENGSYDDYPPEVAEWYANVARAVLAALDSAAARERLAADDELWAGPDPRLVSRRAVA